MASALWILTGTAQAHRNGYLGNCTACHTGATGAQVSLTLDPDMFEPGALVHVTATITSPTIVVGGLFLNDNGVGQFISSSGDISIRSEGAQVTHTAPKAAVGGQVVFSMDWQAPSTPRAVHFDLFGVAANNNNAFTGDSVAETQVTRIFGCTGETFYRDFDGDGYGSEMFPTTVDCSPPLGFAALRGDCNENDPTINPGAKETCNNIDDNCDGRIDEFAGPTCGVGLCRRYADYCADNAPCEPGDPQEEVCDGLDDDCDGLIDEGKLCDGDLVCEHAECKTLDAALADDPNFVPSEEGTVDEPAGSGGTMIITGGAAGTTNTGGTGSSPAITSGSGGAPAGQPSTNGESQSGGGCSLITAHSTGAKPGGLLLLIVAACWRRRRKDSR